MLNKCGFAATFNIELATGRVRPSADKGLLDPPNPTLALCALHRSALHAETKSQTRARPDGAAWTVHSSRARRLRLRPKQTASVRPNKSCRKPSHVVRGVALLSATDRHDSGQPAWHSRLDRRWRFEIGSRLLPTEPPADAAPAQELWDPQKNRAAHQQASALFRKSDSQ